MRKIILIFVLMLCSLTIINTTWAAFPVVQEESTNTEVIQSDLNTNSEMQKQNNIQEEKSVKKEGKKGEKDQLIALLLSILVGSLGVHRFYLGYTWQGVVQLLTAGGCGIWTLIDIIRIATGKLQPKDGRYDKELRDRK